MRNGGHALAAWSSIFRGYRGRCGSRSRWGDGRITEEMVKQAAKLAGSMELSALCRRGYVTLCTDGMFHGRMAALSIARAAAADPAILLLDEITANLDAETEGVFWRRCAASKGRTVSLSFSSYLRESQAAGRWRIGDGR